MAVWSDWIEGNDNQWTQGNTNQWYPIVDFEQLNLDSIFLQEISKDGFLTKVVDVDSNLL